MAKTTFQVDKMVESGWLWENSVGQAGVLVNGKCVRYEGAYKYSKVGRSHHCQYPVEENRS